MNDNHRQWIFETMSEIRSMQGGEHLVVRIFALLARMQDEKNENNYRLFAIGDKDNRETVRKIMLKLFFEMRENHKHEID